MPFFGQYLQCPSDVGGIVWDCFSEAGSQTAETFQRSPLRHGKQGELAIIFAIAVVFDPLRCVGLLKLGPILDFEEGRLGSGIRSGIVSSRCRFHSVSFLPAVLVLVLG